MTKFGVCFIHDEDIHQLKRHDDITNGVVYSQFEATLTLPPDLKWYFRACNADTTVSSCPPFIPDLTPSIVKFILGKQLHSLDDMNKITKCLVEINQNVLSEWKEEWRQANLFHLVYDHYRISRGTSELYNDFVRFLKDVSVSWRSAKLALEQILVKSTADNDTDIEILFCETTIHIGMLKH